MTDLSVGGAFIQRADMTTGGIRNLRSQVPGTENFIACTAIARHTQGGGGLGVEFLDLSPDNLKRLAGFVDANSYPRTGWN